MKTFYLIICLVCTNLLLLAQTPQIFNSTNSKLPEDNLWGITADHKGNIWIGTAKHGLVKYNGKDFTIYNKDNSPVTGNFISSLYVDKKDNLWVEFSNPTERILKYDGSKWTVFSPDNYMPINKGITRINEGADGKMYFGTSDGVIIYDGSAWSKLSLPSGPDLQHNVLSFDVSKDGRIAVGCDVNLLLYDGKEWKSLNESNSDLQLGTVRAVKFMANGELYIGYGGGFGNGGFSVLKDGKWTHYNKHNSALPDQMVRDIKISDDGAIWMATNDGVLKIDGDKFTPFKFWPGKYHNVVMGIAIENGKTIWIATTTGLVKLN
ncbi:MAG TPA: two-component regulator propeller domain-containing protein [Mucilaginibacter sp.]|nr:two-component regulator propeller domain-containing protein [Mucilaginibacter sp.]